MALFRGIHQLPVDSPHKGPAMQKVFPSHDIIMLLISQVCGKAFSHLWNLNRHMIHHTGERAHECFICQKRFMLASHLKQHMKTHAVFKPHRCVECGRAYAEERDLYIHMKTHYTERSFKCEICGKAFFAAWNLNRHMKIHTGEKPYSCHVCGRRFMENYHLRDHMQTHGLPESAAMEPPASAGEEGEGEEEGVVEGAEPGARIRPHCCVFCGKSFSHKRSFQRHLKTHAEQKPHQCPECDKGFIEKARLRQHMKVHSLPSTGTYKCDFCGKVLSREFDLMVHLRTHTSTADQQCFLCGQSFPSASALRCHMSEHSANANWTCALCGKRCTSELQLSLHTETHNPEAKQPHQCLQCGKCFVHEKELTKHMKKHSQHVSSDAPYPCRICGQTFSHLFSLTIHSRQHSTEPMAETGDVATEVAAVDAGKDTSEATLTCMVCKQICSDAADLKEHLRVHMEDTPFLCTLCGQTYKDADEFKLHQLSHTVKLAPYRCHACQQAFPDLQQLSSHYLQKHANGKSTATMEGMSTGMLADLGQANKENIAGVMSEGEEDSTNSESSPEKSGHSPAPLLKPQYPLAAEGKVPPLPMDPDYMEEEEGLAPSSDLSAELEVGKPVICGECGEEVEGEDALAAHKQSHNLESSANDNSSGFREPKVPRTGHPADPGDSLGQLDDPSLESPRSFRLNQLEDPSSESTLLSYTGLKDPLLPQMDQALYLPNSSKQTTFTSADQLPTTSSRVPQTFISAVPDNTSQKLGYSPGGSRPANYSPIQSCHSTLMSPLTSVGGHSNYPQSPADYTPTDPNPHSLPNSPNETPSPQRYSPARKDNSPRSPGSAVYHQRYSATYSRDTLPQQTMSYSAKYTADKVIYHPPDNSIPDPSYQPGTPQKSISYLTLDNEARSAYSTVMTKQGKPSSSEVYICYICGAQSSDKYLFSQHLESHQLSSALSGSTVMNYHSGLSSVTDTSSAVGSQSQAMYARRLSHPQVSQYSSSP